jgi:hypothetical protein
MRKEAEQKNFLSVVVNGANQAVGVPANIETTTGLPLATRTWSAERKHRRKSAKWRNCSRLIILRQTSKPVLARGYRAPKAASVLSFNDPHEYNLYS